MGIKRLGTHELVVFAMLGAIMYVSKIILAWAPNIHLLGTLIVSFTLVYRLKALFPIYIYVLIDGLMSGFSLWWIPYLYVWAVLWGFAMLIPKGMPRKAAVPVCMVVCGMHGLMFGTLYAPAQAIMFGYSFKSMLAWIAAGFYFDLLHGISNFCAGALILPLAELLKRINGGKAQQV
jgi:energy-coupling factor transport system substrate-specific component